MATELEAVNILLDARTITPVLALDGGHPDVRAARSLLKRHKRTVNSEKRWYNTEVDVDLDPDEYGKINIPAGVISLDVDQGYIMMDGVLYDPDERTSVFDEGVEGLTLVFDRDWEDLPTPAFDYIVALAKEEFLRPLESSIMSGQAEKDIIRHRAVLNLLDMRFKDVGKQNQNPLVVKWQQKMIQR